MVIILEICIDFLYLLHRCCCSCYQCCEDATGKIAAPWDEVDCRTPVIAFAWLYSHTHLAERLAYLRQVLVAEGFIYAHVCRAPREMCCCLRRLSCAGASRDGIHHHTLSEHPCLGKRQESELQACGEAARVGDMMGTDYLTAVNLRQSVHKIIAWALQPEVLCKVDYPHIFGHCMLLQKRLAFPMTEAKEDEIDVGEGYLRREAHGSVAHKVGMHIAHQASAIALTVSKDNLSLRMIQQQTNQFATGIASGTKDANPNHILRC